MSEVFCGSLKCLIRRVKCVCVLGLEVGLNVLPVFVVWEVVHETPRRAS